MLKEYARVARRYLLLSVPLEPVFRTLTRISVMTKLGQDPGHVNFWTPAAFRRFVKQAGELSAWDWTTAFHEFWDHSPYQQNTRSRPDYVSHL